MNGCLLAGMMTIALNGADFRLEWTHSVEKVTWREYWRIKEGGLGLTKAAVKGSGAGMEPGEGAELQDDWWVWTPDLPVQPQLVLAASGATGGAWRICDGEACREIGAAPGAPIILRPCP
ncbi:DUF1850 domain-containing protein [Paracoccus saliphilus]|uniref:DUF1850 domain-containing protein n=1 Tax=Paracoccus saliphilus TaxID=405559 RepID=A0AA45W7X3_9RHOB|nr:DUF1850 domain-containing protein [Paracoccus saliphilus]WCR04794.1 DUF1850 domain-containing protein [Paracoccus saliphilus]SIT12708.1 protein of unknown function [Paracoccus saliphilus]